MLTNEQLVGKVDPWVLSQLRSDCPFCGSRILTRDNLRSRACENAKCIGKLSYKADKMLKEMGYKGIGQKTLYKILKQNNMKSHIYLLDPKAYKAPPYNHADSKLRSFAREKKKVPFFEAVSYLYIEGYGKETCAQYLRKDSSIYDTLDRLGNLPSALAPYLIELSKLEEIFEIEVIKSAKLVEIMMTNSIRGYKNRKMFVLEMNKLYGDFVYTKEVGKVSRAQFLVADRLDGSSKQTYATKNRIPIVTSERYENLIKEFLFKNSFNNE